MTILLIRMFLLAPELDEDGLISPANSRKTESLRCKCTQTGQMMSP